MSIKLIKTWITKFYIEILIVSVFLFVVIDHVWWKQMVSNSISPVAFGAISLLLVSVRTRVLLEEYKEKVRGRVFGEYHKLIRVMNGVEDHFSDKDQTPAREVQCAAIFELRHYPEYKEFTHRTFMRWREKEREQRDSVIDRQVEVFIEGLKKDGHQIREDYKQVIIPILTEIKNRKSLRYDEEITSTLEALGYTGKTK